MNDEALPNQGDFIYWISKKWNRVVGVVIAFGYFVVGLYSQKVITPDEHSKVLSDPTSPAYFQAIALVPIVVACFLIKLPSPPDATSDDKRVAVKSCEQFRMVLVLLIVVWIVFYLLVAQYHHGNEWLEPIIDFFNVLQGVLLFVGYYILTAKTVTNGSDGVRTGALSLWTVLSLLLWISFVFLVLDETITNRIGASSRPYIQLASGLWDGACLALFVGCLESQFLNQPRVVTACLFFYAVLQISYVGFFNTDKNSPLWPLQTPATLVSLPLKLIFIGYWMWVFENGLLVFYMMEKRQAIDTVQGRWNGFWSEPDDSEHDEE